MSLALLVTFKDIWQVFKKIFSSGHLCFHFISFFYYKLILSTKFIANEGKINCILLQQEQHRAIFITVLGIISLQKMVIEIISTISTIILDIK